MMNSNIDDITINSHIKDEYKSIDDVLNSIPIGLFHIRLLFLCGFVFMADATEVSLLTFISSCASDSFDLNNTKKATISSIVFIGELLGSLFWGRIADKYGRRISFLLASTLIVISGFLSAFSPSYYWLLVFRCCVGIGVGGGSVPFDLLAEYLPLVGRGKFLIYIEFFFTFGSMLINALAWIFLSSRGWRFLVFLAAIPFFCVLILSYFYLPESPRWLLTRNRVREAETNIKMVMKVNNIIDSDFRLEPNQSSSSNSSNTNDDEGNCFDLFKVYRISIPLALIWFSFGFTYYGFILLVSRIYSSESSTTDDSSTCEFDYAPIFINSCAEILGLFIVINTIDNFGRIQTQILLYAAGALLILLMGMNLPYNVILVIAWFARCAVMGSSSTTWVATTEILPTQYRAIGHAFFNSIARIAAALVPYYVASNLSFLGVAVGFCAINLMATFCSYILPETKGIQ